MRIQLRPLRVGLAVLLVGSAVLFFVGSTIERDQPHEQTTPAQTSPEQSGEGVDAPGETHSEQGEESKAHSEEAGHEEAGVEILGIDTESLALSIVAVVLSVLLAGLVLLRRWSTLVLVAVLVFALVFAAGDIRELVHQRDESNGGIAAIAAALIALHLALSVIAGRLLTERRTIPAPTTAPWRIGFL